MSTYGKIEKVCATCVYWKGQRGVELNFVQTQNNEAECDNKEAFFGLTTGEGASCMSWRGITEKNK